MEETLFVPKRPREGTQLLEEEEEVNSEEPSKRQKPYTHIISLLESDEEEPTQDLSPLISTLQQEISSSASDSQSLLTPLPENSNINTPHNQNHYLLHPPSSSIDGVLKEEDEGDKERVMRHLLEASDDELGIPKTGDVGFLDFGEGGFDDNGLYSVCDGLWELEDETANYYTLLQSELFM